MRPKKINKPGWGERKKERKKETEQKAKETSLNNGSKLEAES